MGQRALVGLVTPAPGCVFDVEGARAHAAAAGGSPAAPDTITHVGIGVVADPGGADIADELAKLFDPLVAAGQVEGDFRDVVDPTIRDAVDLDAVGCEAVNEALVVLERLQGRIFDPEHDPLDAELLEEL